MNYFNKELKNIPIIYFNPDKLLEFVYFGFSNSKDKFSLFLFYD